MAVVVSDDANSPTITIDLSDLESRSHVQAVRVVVVNEAGERAVAHVMAHKNGRNQVEYRLMVLKSDGEVSRTAVASWVL